MPEDPLRENDELLRVARSYFTSLASAPVPRSLESHTLLPTPSRRTSGARRAVTSALAFAAVAAALFLIVFGVGHVLVQRHGTPATLQPSARATATPAVSPPPGGPVPARLNGNWVSPAPTGNPDDAAHLILQGAKFEIQTSGGFSFGMVAVNGNEIDFFNGDVCRIPLPGGVGRYQWTLSGNSLHLTPLNIDPCGGRTRPLANATYIKQAS
ncbi:MAG TPA: hypothetical protein VNY76_02800 [Candidatus Acidoferrales bacterium]|jgi:hypothetical protein|nr:hypothetical protein [Candidatus Acidoferrales bacterium]